MIWVLPLAGIAGVLVFRLRRRRTLFAVLPSEAISTIHGDLAKRRNAKTQAALDAATSELR